MIMVKNACGEKSFTTSTLSLKRKIPKCDILSKLSYNIIRLVCFDLESVWDKNHPESNVFKQKLKYLALKTCMFANIFIKRSIDDT